MILNKNNSIDYLFDVKDGKVKSGLGLGCDLVDEYIRFKRGQMNMILGGANVGKSYWFQWYALAVSSQHDIKWTLWMGEDEVGETMINLIQMYSGKNFYHLTHDEIRKFNLKIEHWFTFIDPSLIYSPTDLLNIFKSSGSDAFFVDPYTGLKRGYGFSDNYDFLNEMREFCNSSKKTVYISLHPSTESQRSTGQYPKGHIYEGHQKPPKMADAEGGQAFANRADDFWIVHRLTQHETMNDITQIHVRKNKRNRTGGQPTLMDHPLQFQFGSGLGLRIGGIDLIKRKTLIMQSEYLQPNNDF